MTLNDELEATVLKRRLLVLYRSSEVTIRDDNFRLDQYDDVASASDVIVALTQFGSRTPITQKKEKQL